MRSTFIILLFVAFVSPGAAQTNTGEMSGVVRDAQGALLPGVAVTAEHVETGVRTREWAPSSFDHRHVFVASGLYQLPFSAGRGGVGEAVLGGWRVNAVFFAQSGAPFTVNLGVDQANIGAGPAQRPDQTGDPNLATGDRTPARG